MPAAAILQLIAQVGVPLATRLLELYTAREPADVTAAEWLVLLKELRPYNELRAAAVTP